LSTLNLQHFVVLAVEEEVDAAPLPAHGQVAVAVDRVLEAELVEQLLHQRHAGQDGGAAVRVAPP
jgi:hypothetical protein